MKGKITLIVLIVLLAACTSIRFDQAPNSEAHITVMPATQTSVMSATEGQWSDRAQRAGDDAEEAMGDVKADMTATAVPTVSIPLTGASPADVASKADEYLHGGSSVDSLLPETPAEVFDPTAEEPVFDPTAEEPVFDPTADSENK